GTQLRSQCTVGFSLHTQTSTSNSRNDFKNSINPKKNSLSEKKVSKSNVSSTEVIRQAHGTGMYECGSLVPLQEYEDDNEGQEKDESSGGDVFLCVGNFYTDGEESALLSNSLYRHWFHVPRPNTENILSGLSSVYTNNLRHTNRDALQCVRKLMIRIFKTRHPGPCVLSRLEVWGQPALSSRLMERRDLLNKWQGHRILSVSEPLLPRLYNSHDDEDSYNSGAKRNTIEHANIEDHCDIPEEFLDPITCEVMTIPLLLPTGQTVDSQTLERYIASESKWGRPASDPFSGVPFKVGRGPIPNVGLKARIDRYLLLNGNHSEFQNIGHSLHSSTSSQYLTQSAGTSGIISSSSDETCKRKHSQLQNEKDSEDEEETSRISKRNIAAPANLGDNMDHNDKSNTVNQEKNIKESDELSINSSTSWSAFNSEQLTKISQKSSSEVKHYLHPINTDRIDKTTPTVDKIMPDIGRSRIQMLNQVASLARPSSSSKVRSLIRPSTSSRGHHTLLEKKDHSSKTHKVKDLLRNPLDKSKPCTLICGDIRKDKFDLDSVLSHKDSRCLCGDKDNLYDLNCNHILCRACVIKHTKVNTIQCPYCDIESQKSQISKHHKKSVFI
ncbi:unnamed protein product, partial [Meganyctiphanes norvegica]